MASAGAGLYRPDVLAVANQQCQSTAWYHTDTNDCTQI